MRMMRNPPRSVLLALLLPVLLPSSLYSQSTPIKARVRDMKGSAMYSLPGAAPRRLSLGTVLPPGSIIETAKNSAVDIYLGPDAGTVRMTESSVLALEKLDETGSGAGSTVEIQLNLQAGTLLGNVKRLHAGSKYHVKVSNGMVGVRDGQFRINAQGFLVLLEGALVIVHVPATGEPAPFTLTAPPPVYFSPLEGIRPAPEALVQEAQNQLRARLR